MKRTVKGLYAVVDNTFAPSLSHEELAQMILLGGCKVLQLRMKVPEGSASQDSQRPLWRDDVYAVAKNIMKLKDRFDFTFIVNDYIEVAGEVKADGVHVGATDTKPDEVRRYLGNDMIIGYSCSSHSVDEAAKMAEGVADYIALGAVFPTRSKGPLHPVRGLDALKELRSKTQKPIVAIGGIDRTNIDSVIATGVDSVAMITALTCAQNVTEETAWYVSRFK